MKTASYFFLILLLAGCVSSPEKKLPVKQDSSISVIEVAFDKITVQKQYDTTTCDFENGMSYYFLDSVPDLNYIKNKVKEEPWLEYFLQLEAYHVFKKVKQEVKSRNSLSKKLGLPASAIIAEYKSISGFDNRAFIIWLESARVAFNSDEIYTCPQATTGSGYFKGSTRISLIDIENGKIINTIPVLLNYMENTLDDCFEIPFCIASPKYRFEIGGLKYHANGGDSIKDGRAEILFLDDYNGDGKKIEFALYNQMGCVSCATTLFGYDYKNDVLVNYPVILEEHDLDSAEAPVITTQSLWVGQMFTFKSKKGIYDFTMDYRGRGGALCNYFVKFNPEKNLFEGKLEYTTNDSLGYSWISYPEQH
ncbi:MAG TPA: hypothetical protein VEC12_12350 [Bacteroidia bacterium]|nr:hypothetical protein [Bacteroidia bacterium]